MSEELDYSLETESPEAATANAEPAEEARESNDNGEQGQSEPESVSYDLESDTTDEAIDGDLPEGIKAQIGRRNKKIASLEAKLKQLESQSQQAPASYGDAQQQGAVPEQSQDALANAQGQIPISENGEFYDPFSGTYLNVNTTLGQNAYYNNLVQHNVNLQRQKEQQEQAKKAEQAEQERLRESVKESMAKSAERFSDYWDVVGKGIDDLPVSVQSAVSIAPNSGDLAYWLKRNPKILQNISQLGKYEQLRETLKHSQQLASYNKVTKATEPTAPLGENSKQSGKPSPRNLTAWKEHMRSRRKR